MEGGSVGGRKCRTEAKMELREDIRKQVKGANMACSIIIFMKIMFFSTHFFLHSRPKLIPMLCAFLYLDWNYNYSLRRTQSEV